MFIDYITLLLINMAAGLAALACFVYRGICSPNPRPYAAVFAATGLVAVAFGAHMSMTWPIPQVAQMKLNLTFANIAYGEMSVLLGVLFLAAALAVALGWSLRPLAVYAALAGLAAIVVGAAIAKMNLTATPIRAGVGFFLSGLGGILIGPLLIWRVPKLYRAFLAMVLLAAAAIWTYTALDGYWSHIERFSTFAP